MVSAVQTVGEKIDQQGLDSITVLKTRMALMDQHLSLQCLVQSVRWGGWSDSSQAPQLPTQT